MSLAINCKNLVKTYPGKPPVQAVRGINFEVQTGECYGVLGPNGAGKTTTIEILEGLLAATSGEAEVLGMRWNKDAQSIRERIGVSLQETRLSDRLTVLETLQLFRSFYANGINPEVAIAKVSLQEKSNAWIKNLSGGQQQRLAVATALVGNPDLIFLDEPTTGLDPSSRRELWSIIESFKAENKTVLLTTHYMEEAEQLCDRVAIFDSGTIIAEGSPAELIGSLGAEHFIDFSIDGDMNSLNTATIESLDSVRNVAIDGDHFHLSVGKSHLVLPALLEKLGQQRLSLTNLTTRHASLEDVFISLTGRTLVDSEDVK
jgi:ABC-2 type transport system ATP-binding protein